MKKIEIIKEYFDLPYHKRLEIAKKLNVFTEDDDLRPIEQTKKWVKSILDKDLIGKLEELI